MTVFSWKCTLKNAMKKRYKWSMGYLGSVSLHIYFPWLCFVTRPRPSGNHSWTDHFRGTAPLHFRAIKSYWESLWNHFHFQAKIGKPKNELFGVDKCLVIELFLPWTVFCYSPLARGFILNLHFKRASPHPSVFKIELITWWGISSTAPTMVS